MDIYDDLERFKQQIQHNTHFQQFEPSRVQEIAMSKYRIFNQLDAQFSNQEQSCFQTESESSSSLDSNLTIEKTLETSIFDSVSKISSEQSLERWFHSTGVTAECEATFVLAGND